MNEDLPIALYDRAILVVISTEINGLDRLEMAMTINQANAEEVVDTLIEKGIFRVENGMVLSTALAKRLHRSGGYKTYLNEQAELARSREERERLELVNLRQSVKINKWQFYLMLIGSIGGLISFFVLIYQFFMGDGGFIDDVFNAD